MMTATPTRTGDELDVPRWLRVIMRSDRAGSSWYIVISLLCAPILLVLDPWPVLRTIALVVIALTGLWLGLLGIAMATGLAIVLRRGVELPEYYWRSVFEDLPSSLEPQAGGVGTDQDPKAAVTVASSSP